MDACDIDPERIDACVFMAATVDGPISMCAYNAERDIYLLKPIQRANGSLWQALAAAADRNGEVRLPVKWLKGKSRATVKAAHQKKQEGAEGIPRPAVLASRKEPDELHSPSLRLPHFLSWAAPPLFRFRKNPEVRQRRRLKPRQAMPVYSNSTSMSAARLPLRRFAMKLQAGQDCPR